MSLKNITKIIRFVILPLGICAAIAGCSLEKPRAQKGDPPRSMSEDLEPPELTGKFESDDVKESSGIAVSQCNPGVMWTINDSGDKEMLYAFREDGKHLGTWSVTNATNKDWEGLGYRRDETGACFIYIGEIGDNDLKRPDKIVYRIAEPAVSADDAGTTRTAPKPTAPAEKLTFTYPEERHNAEALLVEPKSGNIYIVTKTTAGPAVVFRIVPAFGGEAVTAEKVTDLSLPAIPNGLVTGGEIASDGKRVILSDYFAGYELVLPPDAKSFDEIWRQEPTAINIGERKIGEAVAYSAVADTIYATSEGKNGTIYRIRRKKK